MDHKTWLWRKKSSEKTIAVTDKVNSSMIEDAEEKLANDTTLELERSVKILNDKLSSALSECKAKTDLVTKNEKVAEEALAGWEKAEAESASLKQELDEALQQTVAKEERIAHLDAALKECMQQLRFVREEQEHRIHDVLTKTSKESEKARIVFEEKLAETNKKLQKLNVENNHLAKALHVKEKLIEELRERNSQAEADFRALSARLDSTEKTNASMKYEICMLEKEVEIRNEEKEFNRRTADASQKQHLENVKKIAKLETECQRLRLLVRKRLPGPAALAKMKTEVEMLGREATDTRRRSNSPIKGSMVKGFAQDNSSDSPNKRTNYLIERLCAVEEENKTLKETLSKKDNELQSSEIISARTASNLSQVEAQLAELSKGQKNMELSRNGPLTHGSPLASIVENSSNGDAESWASALISELDHFKSEKPRGPASNKSFGVSDMSLMDDFVEMEKLAIVSVHQSFGSSHVSDESSTPKVHMQNELGLYPSEGTGKELVPVTDCCELQAKDDRKCPGWLQDVLRIILEQKHASQRKLDEILGDIIAALGSMYNLGECEVIDLKKNSSLTSTPDLPHISGYIGWRPPNASPAVDSLDQASGMNIPLKEVCTEQLQSGLSKSLHKLIELIEGILNQPSLVDHSSQNNLPKNDGSSFPYDNAATPTGYMVRVFQWKSSELSTVLHKFSHTCNDLLNGKTDLEQFAGELTSAFDWVMNHCFSIQDVSSMRDTIKKHFDWDESQSENELGVGMNSSYSETEKVAISDNQSTRIASFAASNERNVISQMEEIQSNLREENRILKDELAEKELEKKDLEGRIQSGSVKLEGLMVQLQESEKRISSLQTELETSKESKGMIEDQIENYKLLVEDLNTQLQVAKVELGEACQRFSSLEVELEDRSTCCQELESTCLELQLQLESLTKKEPSQYDTDRRERKLQTDWEITAASEKLAECQATILNLGKQLKAMASPRDAAILDKVISVTPVSTTATTTPIKNKNLNRGSSLLDQMLAEDDDAGVEDPNSPMMKEIICTTDSQKPPPSGNLNAAQDPNGSSNSARRFPAPNETKYKTNTTSEMALAIVPIKKRGSGGGFLRKLLSRRKRGSSKMSIPAVK